MKIADRGKPAAVIVIGEKATRIERHAAQELAKYVRAMSGARLPVVREAQKAAARNRILIGRPETNGAIARLCGQGSLRLSPDYPGGDGFVVRAESSTRGGWLVLGGSSDRATLYATYYFLEKFCDVGFFWDGDRIPRARTIQVGRLNVVETPRFAIRQHLQGCAFAYTTWPWDWDDWKQEIDWMAKRRQNRMLLDWGHPVAKRVAACARRLGIEIALPAGDIGHVNDEFMKQHPGVRYVKMQWLQDPPYFVIHPSDPMFVKRGAEMVRKNIERYGTDHVYNADPYAEQTVFLPGDEVEKMRVEFARRTAEYMRAADPQAQWYASGWALLDWQAASGKAFLRAIPDDMPFYVCDIFADEKPQYERFGYFHGRDWGFGVLHAFGGDDSMRGDLAGLIRRVNAAANDPKSKHLLAFYINPEMIRHNILFYELAAQLSWAPEGVSLQRFLSDYARRRYGEASAQNMTRALRILAGSVYATSSRDGEASYQHHLYAFYKTTDRRPYVKALSRALRIALRERERQRDNRLYANDLVDMARQYIADLCKCTLLDMYAAFVSGDAKGFDEAAGDVNLLMDSLEKVLATRPEYCVGYWVRQAKRARRDGEVERVIKDQMLTFARAIPWLVDYQSKDMLELVRFYYRRRVEAYIEMLRGIVRKARAPGGPNLIANAGFEEGLQRWGSDFAAAGGKAAPDATQAHSGGHSARLSASEETGFSNVYQDFQVWPWEAYCFTARVKIKGPCRAHLHVDFSHGGQPWPTGLFESKIVGPIVEGDARWREVRGWFKVPGAAGSMRVYCRQTGKGTACFDDVGLYRVPPEQAVVLPDKELEAAYRRIENEWIEKPLPPYRKPRVSPLEAVAEVFADLKRVERTRPSP